VHGGDHGQRRRLEAQPVAERTDRGRLALDLDDHSVHRVGHPPGEAEFGGRAVDERPEPDALDHPEDVVPAADAGVAGPAHQLQAGHRPAGRRLVDDLECEAHVDEHPLAGGRRLVEHPDVDPPLGALDVDQRDLVGEAGLEADDPSGDAEAHG
jgi:hypothetical protein